MVESQYKIHFGPYTSADAIDNIRYHGRYICEDCGTEIHFLYTQDLLDEVDEFVMDVMEGSLYRKMYRKCSCTK